MLKDIPALKVTDIAMAIVPKEGETLENEVELWDAYLINIKKDSIFNVLINMKGYGGEGKDRVETTNFKVFVEELPAESFVKVEAISADVFHLTNQYWVSFSQHQQMYDKKFVFVKGSIHEDNFSEVPLVNKRGVMIK